jgi:hypothetical protein
MHNAPSVSYPVGRCAFQRWLYLIFTCLASAAWLVWALSQGQSVWLWLGACAWIVASVEGWRALRPRDVTLSWDGQVWCLHSASRHLNDQLGSVEVCWDVQKALLLKWQPSSDTLGASMRWLWLGQAVSPTQWQAVRRAVYARSRRQ